MKYTYYMNMHYTRKMWLRLISIIVVCLFSISNVAWAFPQKSIRIIHTGTLQVQSIFDPITDIAGREYEIQIRIETAIVLAMLSNDKFVSCPDMNAALDKWYASLIPEKRERMLNVISNPLKQDDSVSIDIELFRQDPEKRKFRIVSTCKSMADIQRDES
ncbi:MAG: hypothetical protein ABH869_06100, partial [Candidatus Omnitrophota bacterium]